VCGKLACRDLVRARRPRKPRTSSPRPQATSGAGDVAGWAAAAQLGRAQERGRVLAAARAKREAAQAARWADRSGVIGDL
jgi:hypothetical protein